MQKCILLGFYPLSQKMHRLWNGIAQNYKDQFWWNFQVQKLRSRLGKNVGAKNTKMGRFHPTSNLIANISGTSQYTKSERYVIYNDSSITSSVNKKAQLSLTNPRDAKACQNCFNSTCLQRCRWQYWPIFMPLTAIASEIREIARPNGGLKQGSVGKIQRFSSFKRQYLENGSRYGQSYNLWLIGSRTWAFDWHQDRWPCMTLNCRKVKFCRNFAWFRDFRRQRRLNEDRPIMSATEL